MYSGVSTVVSIIESAEGPVATMIKSAVNLCPSYRIKLTINSLKGNTSDFQARGN
jgi:hypothetical protein